MPAYVLICEDCGNKLEEVVCSVADRDTLSCEVCTGHLTNDYSRMATSNFQLKGMDWPGKQIALEGQILRDRNKD